MVPLDKGLQWVNVKQKPFRQIQAHSGIIRHIQELFRHIQAHLEPCVTLTCLKLWYIQNPDIFRTRSIFRTLAYSEPWYIQNHRIFRTLAYSKSEAYPEPCQTYTMNLLRKLLTAIIIFTNYNYFRSTTLTRSLLQKNKYTEVVTTEVVILCKNYGTRGNGGPCIFDILIGIFKQPRLQSNLIKSSYSYLFFALFFYQKDALGWRLIFK